MVMSFGTARPENGPSAAKVDRCCGFSCGQAAAEDAAAAAQLDRHQIVIGLREAGAGEAHQHAALCDPAIEPLADFRRQRADIGHHDHRQLLVEELADRLLHAAIAEPHVGKGRERAGEIEIRGEQQLRGVAGRTRRRRHDCAAAPALVEQLHGAGGTFARDLQPRDVVAQLDRQVEGGLRFAIAVGQR